MTSSTGNAVDNRFGDGRPGPRRLREPTTVGERIAYAREMKGIPQAELARLKGISRSAVGQWERNATSPPISTIEEIAMILGVSPEWLAFGVNQGERTVLKLPDSENFAVIEEVRFTDDPEAPETVGRWGAPKDWISRQSTSTPENLRVVEVRSDGAGLRQGEKVLVDTGSTRPSPAGIFLYWDGLGAVFARMSAVPGADEPKARIDMDGDAIELPVSKLKIIGRVVGKWTNA